MVQLGKNSENVVKEALNMRKNIGLIKKIGNFATKLALSGTSLIALVAVAANVNASCYFWAHQPELPEGAKKLRKF